MRTIVVTLLLIVGSAGAAQQSPATTSPRQASDPTPGLVPEPQVMSFKLSDPFRLARRSLSTTVVPFVP